jgi:general secretion pathway protein D
MNRVAPPSRHLALATWLAVAGVCTALPLAAQPASEETITMNLRDADIRSVIQWVADLTGRNMVVHRDVTGRVTVLSARPVTAAEAYRLFLSMLQVNGYAAIDTGDAVKIVPAEQASRSGAPFSDSGAGDTVVQLFETRNVPARELAQMLRPLVSENGVVSADAGSNRLVVADRARTVAELGRLIEQLDRAGTAEVEMIRLRHANAVNLVKSLQGLFPEQSRGGEGDQGRPLTLSADERSNSLLVGGDPVRRAQIRRLVTEMDTEIVGGGAAQVIYLRYAKATELAPILKGLATTMLEDQRETQTPVSIEASESANALVVNAPPALMSTVREVAGQLDVRRAQVLVEALIVEVRGVVDKDLGVQWMTASADDLNDSSGFVGVNTRGRLGMGSAQVDDAGNIISITPGAGITLGYFENGNLQAAIRALSETTQANILSTPTIVAIDNQPASLLVGQNVPLVTGEVTGAAADVENPFTTYERKDIGTSLEILPRINQGDSITLEIRQTVEDIDPSTSARDIVTNKREIVTTALVRDGSVLVLGGLISDADTTIEEKVPVLGDLPLIGRLFSSRGTTRSKTNLMVFIRPVILNDEERISEASQRRYEYMRNEQRRAAEQPPTTTEKRQPQPELEPFERFAAPDRP